MYNHQCILYLRYWIPFNFKVFSSYTWLWYSFHAEKYLQKIHKNHIATVMSTKHMYTISTIRHTQYLRIWRKKVKNGSKRCYVPKYVCHTDETVFSWLCCQQVIVWPLQRAEQMYTDLIEDIHMPFIPQHIRMYPPIPTNSVRFMEWYCNHAWNVVFRILVLSNTNIKIDNI